ncbi:MAG: S-layer homology domain-containing protein [Clostridia bacterium]|nr:S-layer homology domain-containing protein [Clostridia bacterium]
MKKKCMAALVAAVLLLSLLPLPALAEETRIPIYIGYGDVDYMAEQILAEIPTEGKTPTEQIRAVYDWIILHCERYEWDGVTHFDEEAVMAQMPEYVSAIEQKLARGELLLREEFEPPYTADEATGFFTFSYDSNQYIAQFAYDMMLTRTGNCAHYSALLALLLGHLGFDCRLLGGEFINRNGSTVMHKWNCVLVDGTYYWLDVRIDHSMYESLGKIGYYYFMEPDIEVWSKQHSWEDRAYADWLCANPAEVKARYLAALPADARPPEPPQPQQPDPADPWALRSDWAAPYIDRAAALQLLPASMEHLDLRAGITRQEFASVAMKRYDALGGAPVPPAAADTFADTSAEDVRKASAIGVVQGTGDGLFDPQGTLTREQAMTMMGRAIEAAATGRAGDGSALAASVTPPAEPFADAGSIAAYAKPYVDYLVARGVVSGMDGNLFAPQGTMTREQAVKVAVETVERQQNG